MKKLLYILISISLIFSYSCLEDDLNTNPTGDASGQVVFKDVESAFVALNGVLRATYVAGWSNGNEHQNFGIASTNLFADLMGEDMVQNEQGQGWFYYDYRYQVKARYNSAAWRSYATWNFYYKLISNLNYILDAVTEETSGSTSDRNNLLGQTYALRAYSYFYLIQIFQKTYIGHENSPGIPIYTKPTNKETIGQSRGTVADVYQLINDDINMAVELLNEVTDHSRRHASHIDYYVANGIKARICLVQNRWNDAEKAAKEALSKKSLTVASGDDILGGFNSVSMKGVMWGAEVIEDQSTAYASFFSHMDASVDMYGYVSRKCISNWLYAQIPSTDTRKQWWNGSLAADEETGPNCSFNQFKFRFRSEGAYASDYIYMRAEEMILTAAEALCRQDKYGEAREYLDQLGSARDSDYATRLEKVTDSKEQSFSSEGSIITLLDEILVQRRIELWCEVGRIFDIVRLKKGFYRNWNGSNHSDPLTGTNMDTTNPEWWGSVLTIPQAEFDGNENMDEIKDQNPMW